MNYSFSANNRGSKFLNIEFTIENINESEIFIQLPAWRPGRYQIENFAKNIQKLEVKSLNNKPVQFEKTTKDCWKIYVGRIKKIKVIYNYYSNILNAGSTWVDDDQIYINPINCCFYVVGRENERIGINLNNFNHTKTAISLEKKDGIYWAENYDELVDSPFILSDSLQSNSYEVKGTKFTLWFQGECKPPWFKLIKDFKKITKEQLKVFGSFPFSEYHFIYQILPYGTYHGVEHKKNTVISFGPGYSVFEGENYEEFLGVSSHELFHAWNVKTIKPNDFKPYDYSKENYSKMGYLTEGITSYYGDLLLKRSGVFSSEQFLKQIHKTMDRHFYNYGTENLSVVDSSFDTWLDGYERGIPNRKSSIYTEGSLLAMVTDLLIRSHTKNKKSLDHVMRTFYIEYAKKDKGIGDSDFKKEIEKIVGKKFSALWNSYFNGTNDYFPLLKKTFKSFNIELEKSPNAKYLASHFGIYIQPGSTLVLLIAPDSPGFFAGLNPGDEIISINSIEQKKDNCDNWAKYFKNNLTLVYKKDAFIKEVKLKTSKSEYFPNVRITMDSNSKGKLKWI
ncbi:MAG: peptidase M61 [Flavobacteriales bacterium]|nr:peptidase M61 [Flavobacteriales bacterium]|tara:strand:+ start:1204 stop:2892 length:1689 start_codon:yes stop_codon:yes gene_type:complete